MHPLPSQNLSSSLFNAALVSKFGGGIEKCMYCVTVNPPNLLKVVLFAFNIIVIESI